MKIISKRYGGGGSKTTINESIPSWMRPYIEDVGNQAKGLYSSGQLDNVAGASSLQNAAFGQGAGQMMQQANQGIGGLNAQQQRLAQAAQSGGYDTTALKNAAIQEAGMESAQIGQQYGAAGTLGSARQAVRQGAADAGTAAKFAAIDQQSAQQNFQNKMAAEQGLGDSIAGSNSLASQTASGLAALGSEQRGIDQQQQDAPWQALQRYASTIYGNPARQSATQSSGGK